MPVVPACRRLRQENHLSWGGRGCSEQRWHHCNPGWATEQDSDSKKREKKHTQQTQSDLLYDLGEILKRPVPDLRSQSCPHFGITGMTVGKPKDLDSNACFITD